MKNKQKENQPIVWFHKKLDKSNQYCLYCSEYIGSDSGIKSNKEHLIGREFFPNIYANSTDFNFIFRCCITCNTRKSNVERHLSTTTLLSCDSRNHDDNLNKLALNKANKDYHPDYKGVFVINTDIQTEVNYPSVRLKFVAPPQSNEDYVLELAFRHIQGLFSLATSEFSLSAETITLLPFNYFHLLGVYPKNDWGNPQIEYCIKQTETWFAHCNVSVANGYFKAILLKADLDQHGWFWALEWNKSLRILGVINAEEDVLNAYEEMPPENWSPWQQDAKGKYRYRSEIPLDKKDTLFREHSE